MNASKQDRVYWNREVAENLGLADSTLRKWCIAIEKSGYTFSKDDQGNRAFHDHDLILLRRVHDLNKTKGVRLENAISMVFSNLNNENDTDGTTLVQSSNDPRSTYSLVPESFDEKMEQILEANRQLVEYLKSRDEQIMNVMKEMNEVRLQLAASTVDQKLEERQSRITEMITMERVKGQLRKEALHQWSTKPEEERIKRTGLFGLKKEEDHAARDRFVQDYIDAHLPERLAQEYGME